MYIGQLPSQRKQEKKIWGINFSLGVLFVLYALYLCVSWMVRGGEEISSPKTEKKKAIFPHTEIGYGPLGLNGVLSAASLSKEIALLGYNTRPAIAEKDKTLLLSLKSSGDQTTALSGETIYLQKEGEDVFIFSEQPTPFFIKPVILNDEETRIEVSLAGKEDSFCLKKAKFSTGEEELPYVKVLKKGKCWGKDLFIHLFGGEELKPFASKVKLELDSQVLFLEEGDNFLWREGQWESKEGIYWEEENYPLAQVERVSSEGVRLKVWDEKGFKTKTFSFAFEKIVRPLPKMEELFTAIKPRTASAISCFLGKRRVVLKEGDWWLKTGYGWKNLKRAKDIEDYLAHRLQGELFVFESITQDKGKTVLKGQIFDPMRTQSVPLFLTVQTEKRTAITKAPSPLDPKQGSSLLAKNEAKSRHLKLPQHNPSLEEDKQ